MKIRCIACGHEVELDDAYDDYEGQVKCWVCGAILEIKTQEGSIKSAKFVKRVSAPSTEEAFERTR